MANFNITAALQLQTTGLGGLRNEIEKTLKGVKFEIDLNLSRGAIAQLDALNAKIATLQGSLRSINTASQQTGQAVNTVAGQMGRVGSVAGSMTTSIRSTSAAMREASKSAHDAASGLEKFASQSGLAARRFGAFIASAGLIIGFVKAVKDGFSQAVDFQQQMVRLAQVSTETGGKIGQISQEISRLSTSLGVSSADLSKTAVVFKQAGLTFDETKTALEAVAKAALAPNFDSMAETAEGAIAIMRQFKVDAKGLESALGSINAVAGDFAVEAKDLIQAVQTTGGAFKQTGGDLNELIALFTSVRSTTRESAESISTGLRTIFTRIQRQDTVEALKQLQVNLRYTAEESQRISGNSSLENQFVGAYEAVRRLSEALATVRTTDPRYSNIIEELGGYRQVSKVVPLIQQFSEAQKALNVAQAGGISLTASAEKAQEALANKTAKVKEEFVDLFRKVVGSSAFLSFADGALKLASNLIKIADALRPLLPLLTAVATIKLFQNSGAFLGQLVGAPSPKRFASGGVIPGVGNTDSVSAMLTPGEFVIKKDSAKKIGYDKLARMNQFADGGQLTKADILKVVNEFRDKTGINFSKVVSSIRLTDDLNSYVGQTNNQSQRDLNERARGAYLPSSRAIIVNTKNVKTYQQLRENLAHELGHALDFAYSPTKGLSGNKGSDAEYYAAKERESLQMSDYLQGKKFKPKYQQYRYSTEESFANAFRSHVLEGEVGNSKLSSVGFGANVISKLAEATGGKAKTGFFGRLLGRFFADGGASTDTIPAMLTPGEYVINRAAASRIGLAALNRANKSGSADHIQGFASGGLVRGYAEGGTAHEVPFRSVGTSGPLFEEISAKAKELGIELKKTTTVLLEYRSATEQVFKGFAKVSLGSGTLTSAQLKSEYGFRGEANPLSPAQSDLLARNIGRLQRGIGSSGFGKAIGDEAPSVIQELATQYSRLFKFEKYNNPDTNQPFSPADVGNKNLDDVFVGYLKNPINSKLKRDLEKKKRFQPVSFGQEAGDTPEPVSRPYANVDTYGTGIQSDVELQAVFKEQNSRKEAVLAGIVSRAQTKRLAERAVAAKSASGSAVAVPIQPPAVPVESSTDSQRSYPLAVVSQQRSLTVAADAVIRSLADLARALRLAAEVTEASFRVKIAGQIPYREPFESSLERAREYARNNQANRPDASERTIIDIPPGDVKVREAPRQIGYRGGVAGLLNYQRGSGPTLSGGGAYEPFVDRSETTGSLFGSLGQQILGGKARYVYPGNGVGVGPNIPADVLAARSKFKESFSVQDEIAGRAQKTINYRGGSDVLSQATQQEILQKEQAAVLRQLTSAQQRLLQTIYPDIRAVEAHRIAEEQVGRALAGEYLPVIKTAKGKILGFADQVRQVGAANAPGAGGAGYGLDSLLGTSRGAGLFSKLRSNVGQNIGYGALFAAPLIGQQLESLGGTAEGAAAGSGTGFKSARGAGGLLTGAATGAVLGSVLGPFGTAVGAVAGGLYGLASSIKQASDEIREVQIGNALTVFAERLNTINALGDKVDIGTVSSANTNLDSALTKISEKNTKEATSIFTGFDIREFSALQAKSSRQELGGTALQLRQFLDKEIESTAKRNPNTPANELVGNSFGAGNGGLNGRAISIIASQSDKRISEVREDLAKRLEQAQRNERVRLQGEASRTVEERNINTFGRLVLAVQGASASLESLQQKAHALSDVFSGTVSATQVTAKTDALSQLGRGDRGALEPLGLIRNLGGQGGQQLFNLGSAVDQVANVLPSVLASVASSNPLDSEGFNTRSRQGIVSALGGKTSPEVDQVITTILNQLNQEKEGVAGVVKELQIDATKFAEKLLQASKSPLLEAAIPIGKIFNDQANAFIDALVVARKRLEIIGESRDRQSAIELGGRRVGAQFEAEATGRRREALDLLSVADLQRPFQARQERLTGLGALANNPQAISGQLSSILSQIPGATERQQNAFISGDKTGFQAAAKSLLDLKSRAADLQTALKHLSDASERSAGLQEKLTKLQQDKDSRLSFGERFLSGDFQERNQINRGLILASSANRQGNLDGFVPQDQKLIIETLRSLGNAKVPGLGNQNAGDVLENLIRNSLGGQFDQTKDAKAEEQSLKQAIVENAKTAADANKALTDNLQKIAEDSNKTTEQQQQQFFSRLEALFAQNLLQDANNKLGQTGAKVGEVGGLVAQKNLLTQQYGIKDENQLRAVAERKGVIEEFIKLTTEIQKKLGGLNGVAGGVLTKLFEDQSTSRGGLLGGRYISNPALEVGINGPAHAKTADTAAFQTALKDAGVDAQLVGEVTRKFREIVASELDKVGVASRPDLFGSNPDRGDRKYLQTDAGNALLQSALDRAISTTAGSAIETEYRDKIRNSRRAVEGLGLNPEAFKDSKANNEFFEALTKVSGKSFAELDTSLANTKQQFNELAAQVQALNTSIRRGGVAGQVAEGKAAGGAIFQARGTDTVPAMLTPGEFVVNAAAAKRNAALLRKINAGVEGFSRGGAVYLAGGGLAGGFNPKAIRDLVNNFGDDNDEQPGAFNAPAAAGPGQLAEPEKAQFNEAKLRREFAFEAASNRGGGAAFVQARADAARRVQKYLDSNRGTPNERNAEAIAGKYVADVANAAIFRGNVADLARRQQAANATDPGAAFGRGKADALSQNNIGLRSQYTIANARNDFGYGARISRQQFIQDQFLRRANGGPVPGVGSGDTVPALLTPGEFVLNRSATSLLGAANLNSVNRYADGGPVGSQSGSGGSSEIIQAFANFNTSFSSSVQSLTQSFTSFNGNAAALADAINKMPRTLTVQHAEQKVNLVLNGAEALARMAPELQAMVIEQTKQVLGKVFKDQLPDAGITV